jgi:hypothetical protein
VVDHRQRGLSWRLSDSKRAQQAEYAGLSRPDYLLTAWGYRSINRGFRNSCRENYETRRLNRRVSS